MVVCDAHNDFVLKISPNKWVKYLKKCEKQNVKTLVLSVFTTEQKDPWILLEKAKNFVENYSGKIKILLHVEDLFFIKNQNDLDALLKIKPFSCGIVWNNASCIGGGANSGIGLTKWGKTVVEILAKNGILIDLAHANTKTFWGVAKIVKNNLYCSHTAFEHFIKSTRNLNDAKLKAIKSSNGFIGVFVAPKFLGNYKNFAKHFEYAKKIGLQNNIGLGSDFYGTKPDCRLNSYKKIAKILNNEKFLGQNFEEFLKRIKCENNEE